MAGVRATHFDEDERGGMTALRGSLVASAHVFERRSW
jgi:hypothetical protein